MLDEIADEIVEQLLGDPEYFADLIRAGQQTPFSANISETEKLRYYTEHLFMKKSDGTIDWYAPNEKEREALLIRVGPKHYAEVMKQVLAQRIQNAGPPDVPVAERPEPSQTTTSKYKLPGAY